MVLLKVPRKNQLGSIWCPILKEFATFQEFRVAKIATLLLTNTWTPAGFGGGSTKFTNSPKTDLGAEFFMWPQENLIKARIFIFIFICSFVIPGFLITEWAGGPCLPLQLCSAVQMWLSIPPKPFPQGPVPVEMSLVSDIVLKSRLGTSPVSSQQPPARPHHPKPKLGLFFIHQEWVGLGGGTLRRWSDALERPGTWMDAALLKTPFLRPFKKWFIISTHLRMSAGLGRSRQDSNKLCKAALPSSLSWDLLSTDFKLSSVFSGQNHCRSHLIHPHFPPAGCHWN